jgi:uncharacterized protein (DUF849 family)
MVPGVLQACLNGPRPRDEHPAIPVTPAELAEDGARAVTAGAEELHVHPRGEDGLDTLAPDVVDAVVGAMRAACPGVPLGLTTGLWAAEDDAELRRRYIEGWTELPDYVSVNVGEPGFAELCALLERRGVGIEAGVWLPGEAEELLASGVTPLRVLAETSHGGNDDPIAAAAEVDRTLTEGGLRVPQLHHGQDDDAWEMLDAALERGRDVRIGLEDTTLMPDGSTARDNAELVAEAARRVAAGAS